MFPAKFRASMQWLSFVVVCCAQLTTPVSAQMLASVIEETCVYGDCNAGFGTLELRTEFGKGKYEGEFVAGEFHGFGRLEIPVSNVARASFLGNWVQGKRQGRGTYWNGTGNLYMGQWQNGMRHGIGTYVVNLPRWTDNLYTEYWLQQNTENYTGDFVDDHYQGNGTYRWQNGSKFTGGFFANSKHGPGTFYYETGTARQQLWEHGDWIR